MKNMTLPCLAALTGLLAAESLPVTEPATVPNGGAVSKPDPHALARMAVTTQIVARLQPSMPLFSRAITEEPRTVFQAVELVEGEQRLPFTVAVRRRDASVTGYVRLSDNAIFIFRPEKKDHIRSTQDPRFAPEKNRTSDPKRPT